ncbi:MAG TPA: AMP-binding protein [Solirubrobacteraceae bacterium]|jgi:long-chain acyl-CoA synthetase|nr:AMP-binding protein [Solirubrobacteraceae bacterium]
MEASTAEQPAAPSEGSAAPPPSATETLAYLVPHAVAQFAAKPAVRYKRAGEWLDVSYARLGEIVQETALGLIELGVRPGERVCILANTRPEWSYADLAATAIGAVVVPIYQTNSPEECQWVIADSGARAIVCEDASQLAKIAAVRERLPELRTVVVIDPPARGTAEADGSTASEAAPSGPAADAAPLPAITLEEVRARGRGGDTGELERRRAAIGPEDPYTFIYTSGTTGPPKGCVLSHGNYAAMMNMIRAVGHIEADEVIYLYLPLAHSYALLIQLAVFELGGTLAYFGGDTKQIVPELMEVKPTYLPSVPRVFEKVYALAQGAIQAQGPAEQERAQAAVALGMKVRDLIVAGERVPAELREPFDEADEQLFKNVRAIFGGRLQRATSGAAPIAKEILEFFWAAGVPVLEGYGMTETATAATISTIEDHKFGTVGRPFPGVELKIAPDGELLIKGPNIFAGYHNKADESFGAVEDGWLHTGDLGSIDAEGYLSIVGRKKDIIITAGGKNLTPANLENDLKRCRWISQAVMHGDQRPYPVVLITLDEEEIAIYARQHDLPEDPALLAREPAIRALIGAEVDRVNAAYAQVEQVKKFAILAHDLTQAGGELTPTLKVKRGVVAAKYAELLDSLYTR